MTGDLWVQLLPQILDSRVNTAVVLLPVRQAGRLSVPPGVPVTVHMPQRGLQDHSEQPGGAFTAELVEAGRLWTPGVNLSTAVLSWDGRRRCCLLLTDSPSPAPSPGT